MLVPFAEPKVGQFDGGRLLAAGEQDVVQLDVPVGHSQAMAVVHSKQKLLEHHSGLLFLRMVHASFLTALYDQV